MAVRGIVLIGDEMLRKVSHPITRFDEKLGRLIDDMWDTLEDAEGAGLAAVQIGIMRRIAVVDVGDGNRYEIINPEIIEEDGACDGVEGCLSIPEKRYMVRRPQKVVVRAQDRHGETFEVTGEDILARCFAHEIDHMNGVLYIDHLQDDAEALADDDDDDINEDEA